MDEKISDLINAIAQEDLKEMERLYDIMTETESEKRKAGLCRYLLQRIPYNEYTILVYWILMKLPKNKIRTVFIQQDKEVVKALKTKVNYQEIAQKLKYKNSLDKLGIMLDTIDLIDIDELITVMPKSDFLLALGTKKFARIYIEKYLEDSPSDVLQFLETNSKSLPLDFIYDMYVEIIVKYPYLREVSVKQLIDFSKRNMEEKKKTISYKNIIKLTLGLRNEEFWIVDNIVQNGTKYVYKNLPMKNYAQRDNDPEQSLQPFKDLVNKNIPAKHIIYIYMNTRLREKVYLDTLFEEMLLAGYNEMEVTNAVRDYWIVGRIKYVTENSIVRVSADSISASRLMIFNSNVIYISGENGEEILPQKGKEIYYKIRNYLNDRKFYIHYPCEKIEYISKKLECEN